jgi:hypothetical protein
VFSRVKKSKYYTEKIRLVASGHAGDAKWNDAVMRGCTSLDVLNCSTAIRVAEPRAAEHADTASMQASLLAHPTTRALPQLTAASQLAKASAKAWALGGCEVVSDERSFLGPERSLLRSQSAAVAILDELLLALAGGSEAAQFSRFAQGSDNATHVDAHEMALHPPALAIRLYNRRAGGMDLVSSSVAPSPPQDAPAPGVPSLAAYAFKGPGGYSVLLLNRSPRAAYRVTLELPTRSGEVRCYRVAGRAPLASNLNEIQVRTEEFAGDPAGGITVPACGIVLVETGEVTP